MGFNDDQYDPAPQPAGKSMADSLLEYVETRKLTLREHISLMLMRRNKTAQLSRKDVLRSVRLADDLIAALDMTPAEVRDACQQDQSPRSTK